MICSRTNYHPGSCSNAAHISIISCMSRSLHSEFLAHILVLSMMQLSRSVLCCATAYFINWYTGTLWLCSLSLLLIEWLGCPVYTYWNLQGMLYKYNDIGQKIPDMRSSLCECRKCILGKLLFQGESVNTTNRSDYTNWISQQQQNMPDLGHPMLTMQSRCKGQLICEAYTLSCTSTAWTWWSGCPYEGHGSSLSSPWRIGSIRFFSTCRTVLSPWDNTPLPVPSLKVVNTSYFWLPICWSPEMGHTYVMFPLYIFSAFPILMPWKWPPYILISQGSH
jgi:hypothetical protein